MKGEAMKGTDRLKSPLQFSEDLYQRMLGINQGIGKLALYEFRYALDNIIPPGGWESLALDEPDQIESMIAKREFFTAIQLKTRQKDRIVLDENIAQYTESGSAPGKMAAAGEYAVGIAFAHDIQVQMDKGLDVIMNFPSEGTAFEIGGISIIKGAKNLEAAKAWVDYVFGAAFQRYHNDVAHRIPVMTGVELAEGTVGLEDVVLIEGYDPTAYAAVRDALIDRWDAEIGSGR